MKRKLRNKAWRKARASTAGIARTAALSPERRTEIARAAALKRWGKL